MKSIAVLFPSGRLEVNSTVKRFAIAAARLGCRVDIYTVRNQQLPPPEVEGPNVTLHAMPWVQRNAQECVPAVTTEFFCWVFPKLLSKRHVAYVGSGIRGLFVATACSFVTRVPVLYHCIELFTPVEPLTRVQRVFKSVEGWSNRRAVHTWIQDRLRGALLERQNRISHETVSFFPVSNFGPARVVRSDWLRQQFGIAPENKIILLVGGVFAPYIPSTEVIQAAQSWPADWVLVLHSFSRPSPGEVERLRGKDTNRRVVFSLEPVSESDLERLVASADVGLALYAPLDDNVLNMGLSSGKLADYVAVGVPVVASALPGLEEYVQRYQCGICVPSLQELRPAIEQVLQDRQHYVEGCLEFFDRELALENYFPGITTVLERLAGR